MKLGKLIFALLVVTVAVSGFMFATPVEEAHACLPCNCPVENPPMNCYGEYTMFIHSVPYSEDFDIELIQHFPDGRRERVIYLTAREQDRLPESVDEPLLIDQGETIALYKMPWGDYQVNAGPTNEKKVFVTIFSSENGQRLEEYDYVHEGE